MNLQEYQRRTEQARDRADERSPVPERGCRLAVAAGTVAATVVRGQHGQLTETGYREALRDSLADLLHRTVALASTVGLDLGEVAAGASRLSTSSAPPARPVPF